MSQNETTAIAVMIQGPTGLTVDRKAVDAMYSAISAEIESFQYDLTTDTGRKRAASLAFGIAKKRTAIEADKKRLKASLSHGQVVLTITLPTERLLGSIARIEAADSLPDKLRVIAAELEA